MVIVFQQKQKTILPLKNKKKSCVIEEAKTKYFFATTINQYKYQLTVASC